MYAQPTPLEPRLHVINPATVPAPAGPFPVTFDEYAMPEPGVWKPGHQLVAHTPDDSVICTACGDEVHTMLRSMPDGFEHGLVWWVIPVEQDGRCMDCVWMELQPSDRLRHLSHAIGANLLSQQLSLQVLAELREVA